VNGPIDTAAQVWVPRGEDRTPSNSGQYGVSLRYLASALNNTEFGAYYLNYHSRTPIASVRKTTFPALGSGDNLLTGSPFIPAAANSANGSAVGFAEYPEKIHLIGLSFNTAGPAGIAFQGEYSYRRNQPVQLGVTDLVLAALNLPSQMAQNPADIPLGAEITGYKRVKMHQVQATATKAVPQVLGADGSCCHRSRFNYSTCPTAGVQGLRHAAAGAAIVVNCPGGRRSPEAGRPEIMG
jgi:hypothetical protein